MESSGKISYFFRKHFLLRVALLLSFVGLIFLVIFMFSHKAESVPVIDSLVPPVGAPGEIIQIN